MVLLRMAVMNTLCASILLSILYASRGEAQGLYPRIHRLTTYAAADINPPPGSTFYVPLRETVVLYCYCQGYEMVQMIHNDEVIRPWQSCSVILHSIFNVGYFDEGVYSCKVHDASNITFEKHIGNLTTINPDVVRAESVQYTVPNTCVSLSCGSTLDEFQYLIEYKWFRGYGEMREPLEEWPEFEITDNSREGLYICQVNIWSIDIRIEKQVELVVLAVYPRVQRLTTYASADVNPPSGSTFYVPLGETVELYCYCQGYEKVQMLHKDKVFRPWQSCDTLRYSLRNVSHFDEGMYSCKVQDASNSTYERNIGHLTTINPDVVRAESIQYAVLNTYTSLRCGSTLDDFEYLIQYTWFRKYGEIRVPLEEGPDFEITDLSQEGFYTCQVNILLIDIRFEKAVELVVIARSQTPLETLPTTANPLTLKYPLTSAPSGNNLSTTSGRECDVFKPMFAPWMLFTLVSATLQLSSEWLL